jgi:hypothetical protein
MLTHLRVAMAMATTAVQANERRNPWTRMRESARCIFIDWDSSSR